MCVGGREEGSIYTFFYFLIDSFFLTYGTNTEPNCDVFFCMSFVQRRVSHMDSLLDWPADWRSLTPSTPPPSIPPSTRPHSHTNTHPYPCTARQAVEVLRVFEVAAAALRQHLGDLLHCIVCVCACACVQLVCFQTSSARPPHPKP